ncbi:MAG: Ig-like domain-containing protein [Burkholderiales bacterium]|nr:Ig-like domain-containing protein [Burkholderiales bacterium]
MSGTAPARINYQIQAGQIPVVPSTLSSLTPNPLALINGKSGVLTATLSPTPSVAGALSLSGADANIAAVASSVAYDAGQSQVAIPVQGKGVGQTSLTASLNGSSLSATVNVSPAPPHVISLRPIYSAVQQGATGQLQLRISSSQQQDTTVTLASSDAAKLGVPANVIVPAGQSLANFAVQGLATGLARVTATLPGDVRPSRASAVVRVVPATVSVTSLLPATSVLTKGSVAPLTVQLSAAQGTDTVVALQARTGGIVSIPASVTVPAGAMQASFAVNALEVGNTLVAATLNGSTVEAAVQVTPVPAAVAALAPASSTLIVGASGTLTVRLNSAQSSVTTVALSAQPAGTVQVPATVLVPAGLSQAEFHVSALAVGQAQVVASLNGTSQSATVLVTPQPAAIASVLPSPLALQQGASGAVTVRLNAVQNEDVTVDLVAANPALLQVPETLLIPAGQTEAEVSVQALAAGSTQLTASLNGATQSISVTITLPPPVLASLMPASQDLPKGKLGQLRLTLDRVAQEPAIVSLNNSNTGALGLPSQVTVPAGVLAIDVPMTAIALGQSNVVASLNGSTAQVVVNVVAPEITGITLTPSSVILTPGQSTEVQATGTYSDGSTRDISVDANTSWSVADSGLASVSAQGRVTALAQGTTVLSASQTVTPTYGNPTPSAVVGQANVTIGSPAPLAMSAAKTNLVVGETVSVSITAPYAAGATPYTVNLSSNGTAALQHPSSVTINPGLTSVTFSVQPTSAGTVVLSASAVPFAPGQLSFTATPPVVTAIVISGISPTSGIVGSVVTLSGEGFASPASANTVAFAGNVPAIVQSGTAIELKVLVPDVAQSGPITVSNSLGSAQSPVFTVIRAQDFSFQVSPSNVDVIQGSSASLVLNMASTGTNAYQGLAKLSASGLPTGVTAQFDPPSLSAYQTGKLTLLADSAAVLGQASVTVRAEATLNGLPWVRESQVTMRVVTKDNVTGVKGRFITPTGAGIAGIIVRQDTSTNQVVTDAGGNFTLTGLPSGVTTLRLDATPANSLYPIWPYNVTLAANEVLTLSDWILQPPPADALFKPIDNATQDQQITDERFPGFSVTLPAGATITGWDGVRKTRLAVQKIDPDKLPVGAPPFPMKEAYQLYFGTPMGGIPSTPIPVSLPNVSEKDPGEKVEIWWFDGSPMGGTGEWKMAGLGTVSADGKTVNSDPGVGIPRFCGVCGLFSLSCPPVPKPPQPCPTCDGQAQAAGTAGNPVDLFTGQEMARYNSGLSFGGVTAVDSGLRYNPVDAFDNRAGAITSFGYGWTFDYDISFWPQEGAQKRLVMPGGIYVNLVDDGTGKYRPVDDTRYSGGYARTLSGGNWEFVLKDGTRWQFEPFAGIPGVIRGGPPQFATKIIDTSGNTTTISRQSNGRILSINGLASRGLSMSYGSNGFVSRITDHTGRRVDYEYTGEGRVSKVTDAASRVTQYTYQPVPIYINTDSGTPQIACSADLVPPSMRLLSSILYPDSDTPTVNTYGTDRVVKQVTSRGETWKFAYRRTGACVVKTLGGEGGLEPAGGGSGRVWDYTCRAGQSLATRTLAPSGGNTITPSLAGTCPDTESEETRAAGWRFFGGTVQEVIVTQPDGQVRRSKFNARGLATEAIDPLGQRTQFVYDAKQQKTKSIDPLGRETKYEYDAVGNLTAVVDALGQRIEAMYDPTFNKPVQVTRFLLGVPSTQGGVSLSYTPVFTSGAYDNAGRLTNVTNPVGLQGSLSYNAQGLVSQAVAPAQVNASSIPTISNGVGSSIAPSQRKVSLGYNIAGDLAQITDAQGNETRMGTDALGRMTGSTDALGYTSSLQYNNLDQATQTTDPLQQNTGLSYDSVGRVTAVTNAAGVQIERYGYDAKGRLTSKTDALNQSETYEYDAAGRLSRVINRKGQVSTLRYNERGQLTSLELPDRTVSYQYDATGRLSEVRDASSVNSYVYDAIDRIVQTTSTTAAGSHTLAYQYDSLGRMTRRTLSGTGITTPEVTNYRWDNADRLLGHTTNVGGQDHTTNYSYDAAGRLSARKVQVGNTLDLITQAYGYDSLDRLSQIKYLKAAGTAGEQLIEQIDYEYDANGRRTARSTLNANGTGQGETPMTASFDAANRMTTITLNLGGESKTYNLTYDANGNLVQKQNAADTSEQTLYVWDASNRLIRIEQSAAGGANLLTASYGYDAFGRRVQSTVSQGGQTSTVQYLYERAQALGEVRDGKLSHRLLTGLSLDEVIARIALNTAGSKDAIASRLYITDALSSVIAQVSDDNSANLQNSYAYSPYGQSSTVGPDATSNPNQYTSRENDYQAGLYFYRARYYDPVLKRFISSDPIGLAGGINTYTYVEGNPVQLFDPYGLWSAEGGVYVGVGASMSIGRDPDTGGRFMSFKFGKGLGWGASYDPLGGRAGANEGQACERGVGVGFFAEGGGHAGPVTGKIEANAGRNFFFGGGSQGYAGVEPKATVDAKLRGIKAGAAAGIEITIFGAGNSPSCGCNPGPVQGSSSSVIPSVKAEEEPWTQADFLYGRRR